MFGEHPPASSQGHQCSHHRIRTAHDGTSVCCPPQGRQPLCDAIGSLSVTSERSRVGPTPLAGHMRILWRINAVGCHRDCQWASIQLSLARLSTRRRAGKLAELEHSVANHQFSATPVSKMRVQCHILAGMNRALPAVSVISSRLSQAFAKDGNSLALMYRS